MITIETYYLHSEVHHISTIVYVQLARSVYPSSVRIEGDIGSS